MVVALTSAVVCATPTFASRGGGGGGSKGNSTSYSGTFSLVLLNSADGLPHYGQQMTFNVSSNAPYPFVQIDCYQNGAWIYDQTVGYFAGWIGFKYFTLQSSAWTGGGASCNAVLFTQNSDGSHRQDLSSTSFQVYP